MVNFIFRSCSEVSHPRFHTGDIVEQLSERKIRIIDRKKVSHSVNVLFIHTLLMVSVFDFQRNYSFKITEKLHSHVLFIYLLIITEHLQVEGDIKFSSLQVLVSLPRVKCYINSIIYKLVICSDQRNLLSVIVTTVINTMFNVHMIFNFHGSGFQGSQFWDFESD
jgi:hypothetical protein